MDFYSPAENNKTQETIRRTTIMTFADFGMPMTFGQGCQMVYFQTKNPNLGKFLRVLQRKVLVYFVAIW
jgi:hypothetical protein